MILKKQRTGKTLLLAAAFVIPVSCKNQLEAKPLPGDRVPVEITAHFAEGGTKTVLDADDDKTVLWSPCDEISVFVEGENKKFISTNTSPQKTTTFTDDSDPLPDGFPTTDGLLFYAVYPYSPDNEQNGDEITVSVPSEQTAVTSSFQRGSFPSVARSSGTDFSFYNVCGGLRFSVGRKGIFRVEISGNGNEILAGKVKVKFDSSGHPLISEIIKGEKSIVLNAPTSGGFEAGEWYYVSILPVKLAGGLTVNFSSTDGKYGVRTDSAQREVKRSVFGSASELDRDVEFTGVGSVMPDWSKGLFDIHAISTGNGECFMYIMPDGTSMLVDAGEVKTGDANVTRRPDASVSGPAVIASYIKHFLTATGSEMLDYMYLTHFHIDHFGSSEMSVGTEHGYKHMGMMTVYDYVKCKKIIDRGWPSYGEKPEEIGYYLESKDGGSTSDDTDEFIKFVNYANSADGVSVERFETGRADQFVMTHGGDYDFEIIDIVGNGKALKADGSVVSYSVNGENAASTGCHFRYGDFDYAACGDLTSSGQNCFAKYITAKVPYPYMEGFKAHHHLSSNSWGSGMQSGNFHPHFTFCQCFYGTDDSHVPTTLIDRATAENGNLFLCAAKESSVVAYPDAYAKMKDYDGHFVCRVSGTGTYWIYKLSDKDLTYTIEAIYGPYESK